MEDNKRIIGLYGEITLAMKLHKRGCQVYKAYIDEQIDFIIAKYYCKNVKNILICLLEEVILIIKM